mmetsp:Transcript_9303/g.23320  ORF Transcript_9303/g.23320 Transcript_9303/m.23320 type:complete len:243 (+) Transcript_9303:848-1576(+)
MTRRPSGDRAREWPHRLPVCATGGFTMPAHSHTFTHRMWWGDPHAGALASTDGVGLGTLPTGRVSGEKRVDRDGEAEVEREGVGVMDIVGLSDGVLDMEGGDAEGLPVGLCVGVSDWDGLVLDDPVGDVVPEGVPLALVLALAVWDAVPLCDGVGDDVRYWLCETDAGEGLSLPDGVALVEPVPEDEGVVEAVAVALAVREAGSDCEGDGLGGGLAMLFSALGKGVCPGAAPGTTTGRSTKR